MPFPIVYGTPTHVDEWTLSRLYDQLVDTISEIMNCPREWVRPFFVGDELFRPIENEECKTVLVKFETGMFHDRSDDDPQVARLLKAIASDVSHAFGCEVEAAINGWHPGWKQLVGEESKDNSA